MRKELTFFFEIFPKKYNSKAKLLNLSFLDIRSKNLESKSVDNNILKQ